MRRRGCTLALLCGVALGVPGGAAAGEPLGDRYFDQVFPRVERTDAISYGMAINQFGEPETLLLDLFEPAEDIVGDRPVVIFAHGGAFTKGVRWSHHDWPVADDFARRGFVAASIDYRLDGTQESAAEDFRAAVRWFKANAERLRIDPDRIAVMGSSAGAMMAMEVSFEPEDGGNSGNPGYPSDAAAGISIGGFQVDPSKIGPGDAPIAMMHSIDDVRIPYAAAELTCNHTRALLNECEMFTYQTGGHPPPFVLMHRPLIVEQASGFLCRKLLNAEECGPFVETVAPTTIDDVQPGWRRHRATVTLIARDRGGSGLDKTYYTRGVDPPAPTRASALYDVDRKPQLGNGERIRYFSTDRYGNTEPVRTSGVARVDSAPPGSVVVGAGESEFSDIDVEYDAADGLSGLARVELYVRRPGGTAYSKVATASSPSASGRFSFAPDAGAGSYAFYTVAHDGAGNAEAAPAAPDAVVTFDPRG